jgi:hypothetical protein
MRRAEVPIPVRPAEVQVVAADVQIMCAAQRERDERCREAEDEAPQEYRGEQVNHRHPPQSGFLTIC